MEDQNPQQLPMQPQASIPGVQPIQNSPVQSPSSAVSKVSKKKKWVWVSGVLIFLILFFTPIPYYQNSTICTMSLPSTCITAGWKLGSPLVLLGFTRQSVPQTAPTPIVPPSPTPTPDPIANWKTYQNTEYNFEFRYPPDLDFIESKSTQPIDTKLALEAYNPQNYAELHLTISTKSEQVLEDEFGGIASDTKPIAFNSINANKYSGYAGIGGTVYQERIYFVHNNTTFRFGMGTYDRKELLTQILSTFKFTDQTSIDTLQLIKDSCASWIKGDQNKVSIKYTQGNGYASVQYENSHFIVALIENKWVCNPIVN